MGRVSEETFFQRRYADGQQIHEKMLNITIHQGNANQNHSEKSPHICQNDYYKKKILPRWSSGSESVLPMQGAQV